MFMSIGRRRRTVGHQRARFAAEPLESRTLLNGTLLGKVSLTPGVDTIKYGITSGHEVTFAGEVNSTDTDPAYDNAALTGTVTIGWYGGKVLETDTLTGQASSTSTTGVAPALTNHYANSATFTGAAPVALNLADAGPAVPSGPLKGDHALYYYYSGNAQYAQSHQVDADDFGGLDTDYDGGSYSGVDMVYYGDSLYPIENDGIALQFVGAPTDTIGVTAQPNANVAKGATLGPVAVTEYYADGSVDTTSSATVIATLAAADGSATSATLGGTRSVPAANGVATFQDLTVSAAGRYKLSFDDSNGATATSSTFTVSGGKLAFTRQPVDGDVGAPLKPFTVAVEDSTGKVNKTDSSTVVTLAATASDGTSATVSDASATVVKGIATFKAFAVAQPGTFTLTADDGGDASATSKSFKVVGDHLQFLKEPAAEGDIKAPIVFTVVAKDAKNHVVTTLDGDVVVSLNVVDGGSGAALSGDTTVTLVGGKATFTAAADDAVAVPGDYTLTATYAGSAAPSRARAGTARPAITGADFVTMATSTKFKLDALQLQFAEQVPERNSVYEAIPFAIRVVDRRGKPVTTEDGNFAAVSAATQVGDGPSSGYYLSLPFAAFHDGVATFSKEAQSPLEFSAASDYAFAVTEDSSVGATADQNVAVTTTVPVKSRIFTVLPLHLAYGGLPVRVAVGQPFSFQVRVLDFDSRTVETEDKFQVDIFTVYEFGNPSETPGTAVYGSASISHGIAVLSIVAVNQAGIYKFLLKEATVSAVDGSPIYVDYTKPLRTRALDVTDK